jgi:hypothetical protein
VDVADQTLLVKLELARHGMPQDVKLSPDGAVFYVADLMANGVCLIGGGRKVIRKCQIPGRASPLGRYSLDILGFFAEAAA